MLASVLGKWRYSLFPECYFPGDPPRSLFREIASQHAYARQHTPVQWNDCEDGWNTAVRLALLTYLDPGGPNRPAAVCYQIDIFMSTLSIPLNFANLLFRLRKSGNMIGETHGA